MAYRIALVGAGNWGRILLKNLIGIDGLTLGWVVSSNPDVQALLPPECVRVDSLPGILSDSRVDAVVVAAPSRIHAAIALQALEHGKHVFLEKPMSLVTCDAERLLEATVETGLCLQVDHLDLYNPAFCGLRERVKSQNMAGRHVTFRFGGGHAIPYGNQLLWEWGPHAVACLVDLLGEPLEWQVVRHLGSHGSTISVRGLCADRITFDLEVSDDWAERQRLVSFEGQGGLYRYDDTQGQKLMLAGSVADYGSETPLQASLTAFARSLEQRTAPYSDAVMGLKVTRFLEACAARLS